VILQESSPSLIDSGFTQYAADKPVGDKASGSDKLDDQLLNERGVE
jgi:hypothetical protein